MPGSDLKLSPAILDAIRPLDGAPDLAVFRVRPAYGGEVPPFTAGQAVPLAVERDGEPLVRYYSIASAPEDREAFEFYVVRLQKPGATQHLFSLQPGDPLAHGEPAGGFTLARTDRTHLCFVATGTGIAPYVSMLRHLGAEAAAGRGTPAAVTLFHGVRRVPDLGYHAELSALQESPPFPFRYVPTVSRPHQSPSFDPATLSRGRVHELLVSLLSFPDAPTASNPALATSVRPESLLPLLPPDDTAIFLCGNPGMIQAFEAAAQNTPYHPHLVYERYW